MSVQYIPKYHMNILLRDFNAEACRKDIFKQFRMKVFLKLGMIIELE
jgi:hypothetical protein